ncbi:MAG: RNA 2',3'-cyclic phosphodiesterase [Planctomycetaceae bacterium]
MTGSVRAFFALRFRAARRIRQVLDELESMGRPVKPVAASGLHVTLKFLGETQTRDLPMLQRALRSAVCGQSAFDVALRGVGAFPKVERPAVVWLGLSEDGSNSAPSVESLANQFEHSLTALGVPAETRAFHPHLTLARIRGRPSRSLL